jgi:hypothetical protein
MGRPENFLKSEPPVFEPVDAVTGTDRTFKVIFGLYVITGYVTAACLAHRFTINFLIVLGMLCTGFPWFLVWCYLLIRSPCVYQVHVPTARIQGWVAFSAPKTVELYKKWTVPSISNLSAIRGTQLNTLLRAGTGVMSMLFIVAIHQDLHYRRAQLFVVNSNADVVPICFLLVIVGIYSLGFFEQTRYDWIHSLIHCVTMGPLMMGSVAICFVTDFGILSIILTILQAVIGLTYLLVSALLPKQHEDIRVVTRSSKICIGLELLTFVVTGIMVGLAVNGSGQNEGNIWAPPNSYLGGESSESIFNVSMMTPREEPEPEL